MRTRTLLLLISLVLTQYVSAQNWDHIKKSGEYFYSIGTGKTEAEADKMALSNLADMIAGEVAGNFAYLDNGGKKDKAAHAEKVKACIHTYTNTSLANTQKWVIGKDPNVTIRRYIKKSELNSIFEKRIAKANDMMRIGDECLKKYKIDMALQYYYWAYSLVRSVQFSDKVKDKNGKVIVEWVPDKIEDILKDIKIGFDKKEDNYIDMVFNYDGKPVSSLEFTYSDGQADCQGFAKDGLGMIEVSPEYRGDSYTLNIEYQYLAQARGDSEMESVLSIVSPVTFSKSKFVVNEKDKKEVKKEPKKEVKKEEKKESKKNDKKEKASDKKEKAEAHASNGDGGLQPQPSQLVQKAEAYAGIMQAVLESIRTKNYSGAANYFTIEGLDIYNKLISYGKARVLGTPVINYYEGLNGRVVARGVQMSFSFKRGTKTTFVEDVVFTFNPDNKIENIAFGLGKKAADDILCKYAPGWKDETRELLMEFMENYKTAYNLKRYDYISQIFADEAVIIIGNVAKKKIRSNVYNERDISIEGKEVITYNRYTKDQYLKNLKRSFARNEFINIRFSDNEIQWLEKFKDKEKFAIRIRQEFNSSTYADKGYLFLLVDMTNHDEPLIEVRTWQPNEVPIEELYNAGNFYND